MFKFIQKYIGWRNWAVFKYNSVIENLFVLFLIAFINKQYNGAFVLKSLLFILFSIFTTTYGYLINDYSDMELDRLHGKSNTFENDSKSKAKWTIGLVVVMSILTSIAFWERPYFIILTLIWFLIATFYSLPPIRLKERGTANIIFVVIAQRFLPLLILFSVFNFWKIEFILPILTYIFLRGLSSDLNHQLEDYQNDITTHTKTFAVSKGITKVKKILNIVLQLEKILLAVVLIQFSFLLSFEVKIALLLWWIIVLIYLAALLWFFVDRNQWANNPFDPDQKNLAQFLHHAYPSVGLPIVLNTIATIYYYPFGLLLLFQIFIRGLFSKQILKKNFVFEFLTQKLKGVI